MKKTVISLVLIALLTGMIALPTLAQEPASTECELEYTVQAGDWLSKIAEKYLGDLMAYNLIVKANNANSDDPYTNIDNPDLIEPGWVLCIPKTEGVNVAALALTSVVWQWQETQMSNGDTFIPEDPASYTVQFQPDGTVAVQADCNQISGTYTVDDSSITIELGPSTMAACPEGSLGDQFAAQLTQAAIYSFKDGALVLDLMFDSGAMRFSIQKALPALTGTVWQWQGTQMSNGDTFIPEDPASYTVQFQPDGTVAVQADCNQMSGTYTLDGSTVTIELGASTLAACAETSLGDQFAAQLAQAAIYSFKGDRLVIDLMFDSGSMSFSAQGSEVPGTPAGMEGITNIVWQWSDLVEQAPASQSVVPEPEKYTIVFNNDGTVNIKADCNSVKGTYQWDAQGVKIELGASTRAYCGDQSLDEQFLALLSNVAAGGLDGGRLFLESAGGAERMGFNNGGQP